jgi:hypothetical protein
VKYKLHEITIRLENGPLHSTIHAIPVAWMGFLRSFSISHFIRAIDLWRAKTPAQSLAGQLHINLRTPNLACLCFFASDRVVRLYETATTQI